MNEPQNEKDGPPVALVEDAAVYEILGLLETEGATQEGKDGAANNTRWVFDVATQKEEQKIVVHLLNYRSGKDIVTDIQPSFHLAPLSRSFHDARVWCETNGGNLTLHISRPCKFRVSVDVMHSANR